LIDDLEQITGSWRGCKARETDDAHVDHAWAVARGETATSSRAVDTIGQNQEGCRENGIIGVSLNWINNRVICFDEDTESVQGIRALNVDGDNKLSASSATCNICWG